MNLVLSHGDLSHASGYQSRVFGELHFIDRILDTDTLLMVFDRNPERFSSMAPTDIPYLAHSRSAAFRFYPAIAGIARKKTIRFVHAHNLYSSLLALSARGVYGYKVVLDYHGRIPEEYVYLGKGGGPSRFALEQLERWAVRKSDHVIVVSEKLRAYLISRYNVPPEKLSVIPCCANPEQFSWDGKIRHQVRREMNLDGKLICTHLGSFFQWYEPELLVQVFGRIRELVPAAHLLVITEQLSETRTYLASRLPSEIFTVTSATRDRVPGLLTASDLGFLLLRCSRNIETASPAKFSEYINSGLPVLITPEVGDFSGLVTNSGIGAIVKENGDFDVSILTHVLQSREELAARCVCAGRQLTWDAFRPVAAHIAGGLRDSADSGVPS